MPKLFFSSDSFIAPRRKNDTYLKKKHSVLFAICTVTGYPCLFFFECNCVKINLLVSIFHVKQLILQVSIEVIADECTVNGKDKSYSTMLQ